MYTWVNWCRAGKTHKKPLPNIFLQLLWHTHFFSRQEQNILSPTWTTLLCRTQWINWIWLCHKKVTAHVGALCQSWSECRGGKHKECSTGKSQRSSASPAHKTNEAGSVLRSERSTNLHQFSFSIPASFLSGFKERWKLWVNDLPW